MVCEGGASPGPVELMWQGLKECLRKRWRLHVPVVGGAAVPGPEEGVLE